MLRLQPTKLPLATSAKPRATSTHALRDEAGFRSLVVKVRFQVVHNANSLMCIGNEDHHLNFNETDERKYLALLIGLLLERAFPDSSEFEHQCMSAGEALSRCLHHFGAATDDGWFIRLSLPKDWITNKARLAKITELPALVDVLEVLLSFEAQYGTVPLDYRTGQRVDFAADVSAILRQMGLLSRTSRPNDDFLLMMTNHHFIKPVSGNWDAEIEVLLKKLAVKTLDGAPDEYTAVVQRRSERPLTWASGYMNRHWRYGNWLSQQKIARSITYPHSALPIIVTNTIAEGGNTVFVPSGYRQ